MIAKVFWRTVNIGARLILAPTGGMKLPAAPDAATPALFAEAHRQFGGSGETVALGEGADLLGQSQPISTPAIMRAGT